jgi:hypothetical protein
MYYSGSSASQWNTEAVPESNERRWPFTVYWSQGSYMEQLNQRVFTSFSLVIHADAVAVD